MKKRLIVFLIAVTWLFNSCKNSTYTIQPEDNISDLAIRILGEEHAEKFVFEQFKSNMDRDEFEIDSIGDKILIKGNSPVAIASGLNWYLKYYTDIHISWEAKQMNFPKKLPIPENPIIKKSPFKYSYYLNYCTFNYTMAFWDWERWEKEIDWMAMNGVNLSLAIVGSEAIWKNTLKRLNFTKSEIADFIPGPAFSAWWLMGNLDGWGGPLSDTYIQQQAILQQKILKRMRDLGIKPILPGFYGMVPSSLKNKHPNADIRDQGKWVGTFKRPAFLSPEDKLFKNVSKIYYEELRKLYGEIEYFSGDPFHEGGITENINLSIAGNNIIYGMRSSFSKSIWVFQAWQDNPKDDLLKMINKEDILILDLDSDNNPNWEKRNGWNQKPWIWNTITNYGGNTGMFGRMDVITKEPFRALKHPDFSKNLKGIGAAMEGSENNSVIYELLFEQKWHDRPLDLDKWLSNYTRRRYGVNNPQLNEAWKILKNTVYNQKLDESIYQQGTTESILCARPSLDINTISCCGTTQLYYDPSKLLEAWSLFIEEVDNMNPSEGFDYDLVEITRQVLSNYAKVLYDRLIIAYKENNKDDFKEIADKFLQLLDDEDNLLSSTDNFLLGKWLAGARARGTNKMEKDLFEYNARVQLTTWSFDNSLLHEYAHKEWSGLLVDFYKPRWEMFFDYLTQKMQGNNPKEPDFYSFEKSWNNQKKLFSSKASKNPLNETIKIYEKYYDEIKANYSVGIGIIK